VTDRQPPLSHQWRRLLVEPERLATCGGCLALSDAEAHYLRRVLRLRPGGRLVLVDGRGSLWSARLEGGGAAAAGVLAGGAVAAGVVAALEQPLEQPLLRLPPPSPALGLAVALPRLDPDVLLRMVCELGLDRIVPLQAERSVTGARLKPGRGEAILREAVEQCERLWLPQLDGERPASAWLHGDGAGWSMPAAERGRPLRLLATTRRPGLPSLSDQLAAQEPGEASAAWVAVGPEGGWSPAEEARAEAAGWLPVSLGDPILRTSTAAVAAAAHLADWRRRLSCGTSPWPSP
jgi:16S rRNA (uracil1498-N3)-methyltransferase